MTPKEKELYNKTDEYISRFENGKERYNRSALFNRVIHMLARDADPMDIIDQLITITDDTQKAFEQYIYRDTRSYIPSDTKQSVTIIPHFSKDEDDNDNPIHTTKPSTGIQHRHGRVHLRDQSRYDL